MTVIIEEEGNVTLPLECEVIATKVIDACLTYVNCPYETEVNLLLTDTEEIHKMNQEFRSIDRPTDVLSFPMIEYTNAGEFDFLEECDDAFHPESGELLLGDIVICKERVLTQAEEYGHSILREYCFLIAHSMLHLFGYDHIKEDERIRMEQMQREIMQLLKIER